MKQASLPPENCNQNNIILVDFLAIFVHKFHKFKHKYEFKLITEQWVTNKLGK